MFIGGMRCLRPRWVAAQSAEEYLQLQSDCRNGSTGPCRELLNLCVERALARNVAVNHVEVASLSVLSRYLCKSNATLRGGTMGCDRGGPRD